MGFAKGGLLKGLQTLFYALEFCCAGIILGIYSWFLWWNQHNKQYIAGYTGIPTWEKAVEGLSGAAALYLIFAVLLTCFLGGKSFFAFIAIILDVLFTGAFIAIAVMTRHGASTCSHNKFLRTPIGNGYGNTDIRDASDLSFACRLNTAAFAVAIIGAFLFAISVFLQLAIARNHKKEKAYGPGPNNGYTSGSGKKKRFAFGRKNKKHTTDPYAKDAEAGVVGGGLAAPATGNHLRPSHDTAYTGTTAGNTDTYVGDKYHTPAATNGTGYHTAPVVGHQNGTVNPYGYDNTTTRPTNF